MRNILLAIIIAGFFMTMLALLGERFSYSQKPQEGGVVEQIKNQVKKLKFEARISGILTAKNEDVLTISADNSSYQVFIQGSTQIKPKYWGKLDLSDVNVGDKLNIVGNWKNQAQTQINATLVRDISVENRWGVFFGDITSKEANNFVIKNPVKGELKIYFDGRTKFISRDDKQINFNDLITGDRIRVKGIYDKKAGKITQVDEIKDFSLPKK